MLTRALSRAARTRLTLPSVHVAVRRGLAERGTADSNTPYIVGAGVLSLAAVYAGVKFASPPVNNKSASPKSTTTTPTESASVDGEATPVQPKSPAPVETPVVETPVVEVKPPPPPPLEVPYVIVGGGTAAYFAMRGIRARDKTAKVLIISDEDDMPYSRTPLSKELWFNPEPSEGSDLRFRDWAGKPRSLFFEDPAFYCTPEELTSKEEGGVAILTGRHVVDMNVYRKKLLLDNDGMVTYGKVLLATGGRPKNIAVFENASDSIKARVTLFRRTRDFRRLHEVAQTANDIVVIGGGFLGSEIAVALASKGKPTGATVTQVFPETGTLAKVLPEYLSRWTMSKVAKAGVTVVPETLVTGVQQGSNGRMTLTLSTGGQLEADHVVVAVGLQPNTELAERARMEVDPVKGGVLVNAELEARRDVWVAGDVASFHDPTLGRRREEHHDHAAVSGRLAGENMAGARKPYYHQSMFWSDLGPSIGFEAIGVIDAKLETVGIWAKATPQDNPAVATASIDNIRSNTEAADSTEPARSPPSESIEEAKSAPVPEVGVVAETVETVPPANPEAADEVVQTDFEAGYGKGAVFYMRDKAVVGLLLWNVYNKIPTARKIIRSQKKFEDVNELAKLLKIHD